MPWAKLGLARALNLRGDTMGSKATLNELIAESPKLMAAYDLLANLHMAMGEASAAMAVLDSACLISPNSLTRHRAIATVAEKKGDFQRVEQALGQVVKKTRNSPLRETADFARLGNALIEMGEPGKAVALLEEARTSFKQDANDPLLAAVEAVAQQKAGNPDKAAAALARALQGDQSKLPETAAMAVAKACLSTGQHETARDILRNLVQSSPESPELHDRIATVLRDHGAAEQLVSQSIGEIIHLNDEAVRRAKAGELAVAATMLTEAARRLPSNMQVVCNAATVLLLDIFHNGMDDTKLRSAQAFQQAAQAEDPTHPKLPEIAGLMKQIRQKYASVKR
jgi:tetratricopeptide (TPR) repeat protein